MILSFINIRKVPWEVLKALGFTLCFQNFPHDLANVNEGKIIFDPSIYVVLFFFRYNSGAKSFSEVSSTKHVSVSIDALVLQNSVWKPAKAPAKGYR